MDQQIKQVYIDREKLLKYWPIAKSLYKDKYEYVYHLYIESEYYFDIPNAGFFWFQWTGTHIMDAHGVIYSKEIFKHITEIQSFLRNRIFRITGANIIRISVPEDFRGISRFLDKLNPDFSSTACKRFKGVSRIHKMVLFNRGGQ